MAKDLWRTAWVPTAVALIIAAIFRLSGHTSTFWFWWGIFAGLILPLMLKEFLGTHLNIKGKMLNAIIGLIYVVIGAAFIPLVVGYFYQRAPFTAEAVQHRSVHDDVSTADAIRPVDTGLRIVSAAHRAERTAQITQWYTEQLAKIRKDLTDGTIAEWVAEVREQQATRDKEANLKAIQKVRLPEPQKTSWLHGITKDWNAKEVLVVAFWLVVVALVILAVWTAFRKKSLSPIVWAFVILFLAFLVGQWMTTSIGAYPLLAGYEKPTPPSPLPAEPAALPPVGQITGPPEYIALVDKYLPQNPAVQRNIALATMQVESGWNPRADSKRGAQGLAQLMPGTAKELGVTDPFDPEQSVRGGLQYLAQQFNEFSSTELALAAYNWGPAEIRRFPGKPWADIAPFAPEETRDHVRRIIALAQGVRVPPAQPTQLTAAPAPPTGMPGALRLTPPPLPAAWAGAELVERVDVGSLLMYNVPLKKEKTYLLLATGSPYHLFFFGRDLPGNHAQRELGAHEDTVFGLKSEGMTSFEIWAKRRTS